MAEKVAEEEAKEPAIMPYNKDQKRPYKNPLVQFFYNLQFIIHLFTP